MVNQSQNAAIYCRLSREDGNEVSQSIESQTKVLTEYVNNQGWNLIDIYQDDGYSGTDFDRPAFKRLIQDIKIGRINIVITKDLSRLGRNYIQTGYYTEEFFPENNVRYIALNDNFDTTKDDNNDFTPFKNIINEWYAKDISKKIRFVLDSKAKNGEPRKTCFPVFGYKYNESNERIIDPETAPIVRLIFDEYIKTTSSSKVAKLLQERKIKKPSYYNALKYNYNKENTLSLSEEQLYAWTPSGVRDILKNDAYIGTYKTSIYKTKNFKNHKLIKNPNCYIFENKYEPIIDKETFEIANKLLNRTRSGIISIEENRYKGLILCSCCGKKLRYERKGSNGVFNYSRYYCTNNTCDKTSNIQKKYLDEIILNELNSLRNLIISKETEFTTFLENKMKKPNKNKYNYSNEINNYINKSKEVDDFIQKLFEANAKNQIPESTFNLMMKRYKKEKQEFEERIKDLTKLEMKNENKETLVDDGIKFINILKSVNEKELLDSSFLNRVIDCIYVETKKGQTPRRKFEYLITIRYMTLDNIIKEFMDSENSNLCKTI